jgi:hypothetical protein
MALALNDRVQQQGTANTTVSFTLTASVTGFQTFAVIGNGNTTYYSATDASGNWEVGIGTYSTTGPTLTRTTILSSSNSNTAVTFSGTVNVFVTYPSEKSINQDESNNVYFPNNLYFNTGAVYTNSIPIYGGSFDGNQLRLTNGGGAELNSLRDGTVKIQTGTTGSVAKTFTFDINGNLSLNRLNQSNTNTSAAGGVTALTTASSYIHTLSGTGNQTYTMPDATTLSTGVAFLFNNMATGTLTLQDYATGAIGTIPTGGAGAVFLTVNATVGGTWDLHAYLPEGVTFGTNAFNLGTSVITGGTWNGGTIGTAYGGTGLTSFSAANYALYSTSSSALTAGTLPVAAGGTNVTSFTANGIVYGNGTSALGVTAAGTTGEVLIGNTGSAPTWGSLSGSAVTTFQTSLNGLTPSTATSGAVTLAGTLGATSGGTGLTSYTTGDILYASATNTLSKLTAGTNGQVLTLASGVPSWASSTASGVSFVVTDFVATAAQTTFTVTYTVGLVEVYRNGAKLGIADYTASNGTTIVLATGANAGDLIEVVAFGSVNTAAVITAEDFSGTGSQTVYTMSVTPANSESVFIAISGVVQDPSNYTVTGTTLTFSTAPPLGTNNISCRYLGLPTTTTGTGAVINATNGIIINNQTISASYTIPVGSNAMSTGPVTAASGVTVTVSAGSRYIVI